MRSRFPLTVAQNIGANQPQAGKARDGLWHRNFLIIWNLHELFCLFPRSSAFRTVCARDSGLSTGAADYLKAYAIDTAGFHLCLLRRLL